MSVEPVVRQNVDAFVDLFKRMRKPSLKSAVRYRTWIDCKTGQLCFAQEGKLPPQLKNKEWKQLDVTCFYDVELDQVRLEEREPSAISLEPTAVRVFRESIRAFKEKLGCYSWPKCRNFNNICEHLGDYVMAVINLN